MQKSRDIRAQATASGLVESWVQRAKGGDADAFACVYEFFYPYCLGVAYRCGADPSSAEEIVQEAMFRAWHKLDSLRDPQSFKSWLAMIVRNTSLSTMRGEKHFAALAQLPISSASDYSPFESVVGYQMERSLVDCLEEMPAAERQAFVLHSLGGASYASLAADLDTSESVVRQRVCRARRKLRRSSGFAILPFAIEQGPGALPIRFWSSLKLLVSAKFYGLALVALMLGLFASLFFSSDASKSNSKVLAAETPSAPSKREVQSPETTLEEESLDTLLPTRGEVKLGHGRVDRPKSAREEANVRGKTRTSIVHGPALISDSSTMNRSQTWHVQNAIDRQVLREKNVEPPFSQKTGQEVREPSSREKPKGFRESSSVIDRQGASEKTLMRPSLTFAQFVADL